MAKRTVGLKVQVDGEQQYKQALSELNKGNQVLASEMRKLAAEYKGNEGSIEALTKREDLLGRQLLQQRDKVQTLRDALKNAADQYGEADRRTQEWQIKLNDAEAAQYKLEQAIDENNKAIENQGKAFEGEHQKMVSLGDAVDQVAGKLGIRLPSGAKKALEGMQGLSAGSVAAMSAIAAGVAFAVKVVKELHSMTLQAAADVDEVITKSMVTGISTRTLQQWRYAENLIDVSVDTMTGSLTKLTRNMAAARDGNENLAQAFGALGVSITNTDGSLRNAETVFYEVIDALGEIENATERDALTMELMGKSAQELNPLILQGGDALRALAEEAEAAGYVLDESQIKKLGEVDDAYQRTQLQVEALRKEIAAEFAPASQAAMELFSRVVTQGGKALVDSRLIGNLGDLLRSVLGLIDAGTDLVTSLPGWVNPLEKVSATLRALAMIAATVADALNLISGLAPWNWGSGKATTALGWNIGDGRMSNLQQLKYSGGISYNAAGNDNWRGGLTWVGEAGPELVALPGGTQIMNAQDSRSVGGDVINVTVDMRSIRDIEDLLRIAKSAKVRRRMK